MTMHVTGSELTRIAGRRVGPRQLLDQITKDTLKSIV